MTHESVRLDHKYPLPALIESEAGSARATFVIPARGDLMLVLSG
jgi:hypothetical protein